MHNYIVSSSLSPAEEQTNRTILESAVSYDMYNHWLSAEMLSDGGHAAAATYSSAALSLPSGWLLADAVTSGVAAYVRRHQEWRSGAFKVRAHWMSDVSGGAVRFGCCVFPVSIDTVYPTFAVSVGNNVDGPASANQVQVTEFLASALTSTSMVNASNCGVMIGFRRAGANAADTNTGTVRLLGLELVYLEDKRQVGNVFRG